jgi:hypothetical protein
VQRAEGFIVNGIVALAFSLAVWRLTDNFVGWLILFAPGAGMVIAGLITLFRDV